jgi:hypothetical protein
LRQHRFGDQSGNYGDKKGKNAIVENKPRQKTDDADMEIINLVENIETVSRRAKKM